MKYYTGIGSRETPEDILEFMKEIASKLESLGWILRSGGAPGADLAFENGVKEKKEIYIPWKGFNNSDSNLYFDKFKYKEECLTIASENHPDWNYLKEPLNNLPLKEEDFWVKTT
jgi:predicted Rossmann fold nucleotide-binding protein DprA/Smf involved in DNA uptake